MTTIRKKVIKGNSYYYLVETARVNGKSKTVWQQYLGTAAKIKLFFATKNNLSIHSKIFGSVASMLSISEELEFKDIINKTITDNNYKLAIWQHILMQAICRFHKPISKKKSIRWYKNSILPSIWKRNFSSPQTIMNQFNKLINQNKNHILRIEEELCKVLLKKGIKPSVLIWDPTNFFTHIEKGEKLPRRGKSKEKRFDKNIINLGLVVSNENIPLLHTVYEGNEREVNVVTRVVDSIYSRLKKLGGNVEDMVFVFDKGNNSKTNIVHIESKLHFIGSLKRNQLKQLFDIELSKFDELYKNKKGIIKGYKTTETVYKKEYTVIVTYNEKSYKKQKLKVDESVKKIKEKFKEIETIFKNKKGGKKSTIKGISGRINDFLYRQYRCFFSWSFDEKTQKLSWYLDKKALEERKKTYGKNILFTDLDGWSCEKIVKTYNSKSILEDDFKIWKDRLIIPVKPFYVRKDNSLRAHIFICVLCMIFYRYMLWKLKHLKLKGNTLNEEIKNMRIAFIKQEESNSIKRVLENMTPKQIQIYSALNLGKYFQD